MKRPFASPIAAFTLLELIVAVSITVILAALLLTAARSSTALWSRTSAQLATAATARAVLDQVEADLRSAVFREDGGVWLAATVLSGTTNSGNWVSTSFGRPPESSLILAAPSIEQCRFGPAGVWLRMFTAPASQPAGEVRAVAYQIVRRRQTSASSSEIAYMLFRSVVTAQNTLNAGYNLDPATGGYRVPSGTSGAAGNLISPPLDTVIADHVVDFGVRFYRHESSELRPLFPAVGGSWSNAELMHYVRLGPNGSNETAKPDFAEIVVRILSDEGAALLRAYENSAAGYVRSEGWWDIVERHSHIYTRVFPILTGSI